MKIEITNGYVEMSDFLTRKADRIYSEVLFENAEMDEAGKLKASPKQIDIASQALTLSLIKKIVIKDGDNEKEVEATSEWLDDLNNIDYKKIDRAAFKIKSDSDSESKK